MNIVKPDDTKTDSPKLLILYWSTPITNKKFLSTSIFLLYDNEIPVLGFKEKLLGGFNSGRGIQIEVGQNDSMYLFIE